MTIDPMAVTQEKPIPRPYVSPSLMLMVLGMVLIAASFFPAGDFVNQSSWTREDSAAYDQVTQEYKRSTYQSAARSGLSPQQWEAQRERMKRQLAAMNARLESARQRPQLWSRALLWTGALLTVLGALWHKHRAA